MDATALLAHLSADGQRLVGAAARTEWDAPVPTLDWTVRELVVHLGGIQRWATEIVSGAPRTIAAAARATIGVGPADDELADWFAHGHQALVAALAAAPDDLDVWTFLPGVPPREFWIRRQAHELAVHRADVQLAAGKRPEFDAELAQDGIGELLELARRRSFAVARDASIGLDAADGPSWLITFGGERNKARRDEDLTGTDVTVRGRSADLYLWLWNRPCAAVVDGDEQAAALWTNTVKV